MCRSDRGIIAPGLPLSAPISLGGAFPGAKAASAFSKILHDRSSMTRREGLEKASAATALPAVVHATNMGRIKRRTGGRPRDDDIVSA
ncbi:hypothetical protein CCM_06247 [Cordyceps militaris CM01]|uniref:Uncharacterized protein n=1 Tax=Cordyceps militaris (strain CM01) TaxID=983644 RepID=G3JJJ9_CORMM|nr:uncharacterized protein CCM_06247 [Cordyceps militaris CM01]EGX92087.1 hypothetical protein CCM_06247 [Cordyceps militaris CM01]